MTGPYFVRASDIITHLRAMFKNDVQEKTLVDINKLVSSVLALARIDLQKHKIELQAQLDDRFPKVLSNQVQLQPGDFELGHECHRGNEFFANSRAAHKNRTEPIQ